MLICVRVTLLLLPQGHNNNAANSRSMHAWSNIAQKVPQQAGKCTLASTHTHTHIYIHTHMHFQLGCARIGHNALKAEGGVYIYIYIHINNKYIYIYICMYIYIYIYVCLCLVCRESPGLHTISHLRMLQKTDAHAARACAVN